MKPENTEIKDQTTEKAPRRNIKKIVQKAALYTAGFIIAADAAGAVATELTDGKSFLNDPSYTNQSGIVQKVGYDLSHPLGFIKNLEKDNQKVIVTVPSTYIETTDPAAQAALNHATGKDGSSIDYSSSVDPIITTSETLFQATSNGTTVSDSQLSSFLESAVKPFDESTLTANVSLLFPIKNPGNQIITIDKIANTFKGWNMNGVSGPEVAINWETELTIPDKGSEIIVPIDAEVYKMTSPEGSSAISTILIYFSGPDGTNYELSIYEGGYDGTDDNVTNPSFSSDSILPILTSAPEIDYDTYVPFSSAAGIKGEALPAGTPILITFNNNTKIGFSLRCDKHIPQPAFNFISSEGKLIYLP